MAVVLAGSMASLAVGQDDKPARRVESVTWNAIDHKLTWLISQGSVNGSGKFQANDVATYVIDMDEATMTFKGEGRRFSRSEAVSVRSLMDLVAKYAAESTLWWDAGEGEPIDRNHKPDSD